MNKELLDKYIEETIEKEKRKMRNNYLKDIFNEYISYKHISNTEKYYDYYINEVKIPDVFRFYLLDNKKDIIVFLNCGVIEFLNTFYEDFYNSTIKDLLKDEINKFNN